MMRVIVPLLTGNSSWFVSVLQCLSHVEPLTQYFLSGAYEPDQNPRNPLGTKVTAALITPTSSCRSTALTLL